MNKETFFENENEIKVEKINRIPLRERMDFQLVLMQIMLGEKSTYKDEDEWNKITINWAEIYGREVSNIIDNPKNKEIRDLIMEKKYKDASFALIKILETKEIDVIV